MLNNSLIDLQYLFSFVTQKVNERKKSGQKLIDMGVGDVTLPLGEVMVSAGIDAISQLSCNEGFVGYGNCTGYDFLKDAIINYYADRVQLNRDEIFISDGAKSDCSATVDLFRGSVIIVDPVYPVYVNANKIQGNPIIYFEGNRQNGFKPKPDYNYIASAVYICSPSNPTGVVYTKAELYDWVNYCKKTGAILIFDSAYESYIIENYPRSIFEIDGAEDVAIEINSFSKSAGFTGLRCGYTIIKNNTLKSMWKNRQSSKFNGASYPIQCMAAAAYSKEGKAEWQKNTSYYLENSALLYRAIFRTGRYCTGGINSPYVWFDCGQNSLEFFDKLLDNGLVVTPGYGFGKSGQNFIRVTGFSSKENTKAAIEILKFALKNG